VIDLPYPAFPKPPEPKRRSVRWIGVVLIVAAIIGAGVYWGVPALKEMMDTASTDDAYVQGHITYVSPRVDGVVTEVLVDQDDRVEPGELLAKLDREPFDVAVAQSQASLEEARANVAQSRALAHSQIARARGADYQRKNALEILRRQIATLNARGELAAHNLQGTARQGVAVPYRPVKRVADGFRHPTALVLIVDDRNPITGVGKDLPHPVGGLIESVAPIFPPRIHPPRPSRCIG
jgi:multidrug efflux pump subunit AcrA (membrane-fusion protein)